MPEKPLSRIFNRLSQNIQDLDIAIFYRNKTTNPYGIRYKDLLENLEQDLGIDSPFEYAVVDGEVSIAIKRGIQDLSPDNSVFIFDGNFNLVEDLQKEEDKYFIREDGIGGDISVKPITV